MGPGLSEFCFVLENCPKRALRNQYRHVGVVYHVYSVCIYKVVGYYDLSVLSMSVMGFQKNLNGGIFGMILTLQSPIYNTDLFFYFISYIFLLNVVLLACIMQMALSFRFYAKRQSRVEKTSR